MIELLNEPFVLRAMIAGILLGFVASYFGAFVVQRRMSFLGDGLAHAAFGGVALGLYLGTSPLLIAVPFTLLTALAITYLKEKTKLESDTSIGIFFAVSVAIGIVFISLNRQYSADAYSYLFGSIITVSTEDIWMTVGLALLSVVTFFGLWKRWAYATFDPELARADGLNVLRDDFLLSLMIALTVVIAVKVVGIVLIASYLVIPAATARMLSRRFFSMTVASVCIGIVSSLAGLVLSIELDMPTGAMIILIQSLLFVAGTIIGKFRAE